MKRLNWLHFTDLHAGMKDQDWLWPTFQNLLFDDLTRLYDSGAGPWDLIFFSGDATQSGSKDQFKKFSEILNNIYEKLNSFGCNPIFLSVPGNHDLSRPDPTNPVVRVLQNWFTEDDIRDLFWNSKKNEYRQAIDNVFINYSEWWNDLNFPKPSSLLNGILPGDFSAIVEKTDLKIGVVGLNTAFLQLNDSDYFNCLDIHAKQLNEVCDQDPDTWAGNCDIAILMSHHGIDWLNIEAQDRFLSEIYTPDRFFSHICGHMHVPQASNFSFGGSKDRRYRQGPSLFGLEFWGTQKQTRIQGYTVGQFEVTKYDIIEKIWPRRLVKKMGGHRRLDPDFSYDLNETNCIISSLALKEKPDKKEDVKDESQLTNDPLKVVLKDFKEDNENSTLDNFGMEVSLLSDELNDEQIIKKLENVPRFNIQVDSQHLHIRQVEKASMESLLLKDKCVWLSYDWGLGKDSFIASVIDRLDQNKTAEVFRLLCDDIATLDQFESLFVKQFGLSLQEFCTFTAQLKSVIFIIDAIPPELIHTGSESKKIFDRILSSISDFSPETFLILTSRQSGIELEHDCVELKPLDISDVANYIKNHPKAGPELYNTNVIETLYMRSEGLPMHLDRLIETLQVASLGDLTDIELDLPLDSVTESEPIPKALKQAVASLSKSTERYTRRSFKMLKVLSVLPEGESLQSIRRVYQAEPFFPRNATELLDFSLLNVVAKERDNVEVKGKKPFDPFNRNNEDKILCVPRQVRDYIHIIITKEEKLQIVQSLTSLLFGGRWREGMIKMRRAKTLGVRGARSTGPGNEHAIILFLLKSSIEDNDPKSIVQILKLAINYCIELKGNSRYNDAFIASSDFLTMIENNEFDEQYVQLAIIKGQSLRMIGQRDSALEILNTVIKKDKNFLNNDKLSDVHLDIALIHESNQNSKEAVMAAQKVQDHSAKDSSRFIHAESIILQFEEEAHRKNALKLLEKKARNKGHYIVANNIALDLARESKNDAERTNYYESVLSKSEDPYNRIRAAINKVTMQSVNEKNINSIKPRDLMILNFAYSYLFSQRMTSLFTKCHKAIWWILKIKNDAQKLLKIYRLSSFVWRIRDKEELEITYLKEIKDIDLSELIKSKDVRIQTDINYFKRRLNYFMN